MGVFKDLFKDLDGALIDDIRLSLNKGLALGNERFKTEIEELVGRRMVEGKRGRPLGWRKKKTDNI